MQRSRNSAPRIASSVRFSTQTHNVIETFSPLRLIRPVIGTLPTPQQMYGELPFQVKIVRSERPA